MEDINAKFDNISLEQVMGKHELGVMNENRELFANHCTNHNLVIQLFFPYKQCHWPTLWSPEMKTETR